MLLCCCMYVDWIVYFEYLTSKLDQLGLINNGGEESNDDKMYIYWIRSIYIHIIDIYYFYIIYIYIYIYINTLR